MQFSLFDDDKKSDQSQRELGDDGATLSDTHFIQLPLPEADVRYYPNALSYDVATACFEALQNELPWRQDAIKLFGKSVNIPRLQSWHGDAHCTYTYSNLTMAPNPWTETLSMLRDKCEDISGTAFNSVLANWYRNGQDSMSLHADDEPELGINPTIASLTLGEGRPFVFKHKETKARFTQVLEHGSVLIMAGTTQSHYVHGIAKTTKSIGGRINLTFRHLIKPSR